MNKNDSLGYFRLMLAICFSYPFLLLLFFERSVAARRCAYLSFKKKETLGYSTFCYALIEFCVCINVWYTKKVNLLWMDGMNPYD